MLKFASEMNTMLGYGIPESKLQVLAWWEGGEGNKVG